jgi:hypothetical protein
MGYVGNLSVCRINTGLGSAKDEIHLQKFYCHRLC